MPQMKGQEKKTPETCPNGMEISNLPDKEFKEIVIRMLTKLLESRLEKLRKCNNQSEMNTITEMKIRRN